MQRIICWIRTSDLKLRGERTMSLYMHTSYVYLKAAKSFKGTVLEKP